MWHLKSAVDHAAAIRRGEVTSAALAEYYIDRIERLDGDINAVVVRLFDSARARAREADAVLAAGQSCWGLLHGVPVTVKEAFWVEGSARARSPKPSTSSPPRTRRRCRAIWMPARSSSARPTCRSPPRTSRASTTST